MDWTKIKTKHFLFSDLTQAQKGDLADLLCLTAHLEKIPTQKQMQQVCRKSALKVLHLYFKSESLSLHFVLEKVLEDVEKVDKKRKRDREYQRTYDKSRQRDRVKPQGTNSSLREDKIRLDKNKPPISPKGGMTYSDSFESFWKEYPKKVGKGAAYRVWKRLNPNRELSQQISTAISSQRTSDQWERDNGQYIPNPATWLNQERFNDEPEGQSESFRDRIKRYKGEKV